MGAGVSLSSDPGRALADYGKAQGAGPASPELERTISEKKRDAADRWLRAEHALGHVRRCAGRFGLVLHGVGGGSGRGTSDSALYVPMGLDAGVGVRLLLRVGDGTSLQLLGERIWRPLREQGDLDRPVLQRLRYEARLVFRDGEETAVSASCSFHQRSTSDVAFPATDILGRSCDASLLLPF